MQLPDLPTDRPLVDAVVRLLATRGPLTYEQISEALGEDPDDAEWEDRLFGSAVDEADRIVELADERLADAVSLLGDWTLTRRLTAAEASGHHLELGGDLQPFVAVIEGSVPLACGGRASVQLASTPGQAETEHLAGPSGWMGDAAEGDLVGLRLADGLLSVTLRPATGDADAAAKAFAAAADERIAESEHDRAGLVDVVWDAAAVAPHAFSGTLPPLSDIAAAAGLQLTETMVLPADADADRVPATTDAIRDAIARVYADADDEMLEALAHLRAVSRRLEVSNGVSDDDLTRAAAALAEPDVYGAFVRESVGSRRAARLGAAVASRARGAACAGACHLQARHAWDDDDIAAVDALLRDALDADPGFEPALADAARIAEMRGDATGALRYLQRAGVRDAQRLRQLRTHAAGVKVGRNDPCPCGSGRKSKRCCGGGGTAKPLDARAGWLLEKLYLSHGDRIEQRLRERLEADGRVGSWVDDDGGDHAVVADVALYDLGLFDDFLRRWAEQLPDDERKLAELWRSTHRGLYEVRKTHGAVATLVDRRDGLEHTAHHNGVPPPRGATILARLLPDGGTASLLAMGVAVEDEHHPAVTLSLDADADPLDVAEIWGAGQPLLATTEGEPSVLCTWEASLAGDQHGPLRDALLARGLSEDERGVFTEMVEVDGLQRLRGTVTVTDDVVRITTGSQPRLERLVAHVRNAVGDVEPRVDRRTRASRAMADQRLYGVPAAPVEPTAEERALIDEMIRMQEQRWVDEPVPALSNLTPREARDHPTGRRALEHLLDSFDDAPAGGFDTDRLRSLLDL